jgi:hypothetical protein
MQSTNTILGTRKKQVLIPRTPRTQLSTDKLADYMVEKFKSPEFKPFFLRVAWHLDKGTIDRLMATAIELGTNKRAYFIALVKKEPSYYE